MINKDIRDDIKIVLSFSRDPRLTKFRVSLFSLVEKYDGNGVKTTTKRSVWDKAFYDGIISENLEFMPNTNNVLVKFNYADTITDPIKWDRGWFAKGRLHGTVYISYEDSQMQDGLYDEMVCLNVPIEIVNKDECDE